MWLIQAGESGECSGLNSPGCSSRGALVASGSVGFSGSQAGQHLEEGHFSEDGDFRAGKVFNAWGTRGVCTELTQVCVTFRDCLPQFCLSALLLWSVHPVLMLFPGSGVSGRGGCKNRRAMGVLCTHWVTEYMDKIFINSGGHRRAVAPDICSAVSSLSPSSLQDWAPSCQHSTQIIRYNSEMSHGTHRRCRAMPTCTVGIWGEVALSSTAGVRTTFLFGLTVFSCVAASRKTWVENKFLEQSSALQHLFWYVAPYSICCRQSWVHCWVLSTSWALRWFMLKSEVVPLAVGEWKKKIKNQKMSKLKPFFLIQSFLNNGQKKNHRKQHFRCMFDNSFLFLCILFWLPLKWSIWFFSEL